MINPKNKFINKQEILCILNKYTELEINIFSEKLYQRAFANECFIDEEFQNIHKLPEAFRTPNETLEIVGDSILGSIIVEYLEERYPEEREGFISLMKTYIAKTEGLALFAKHLNFSNFVLISCETEALRIRNNIHKAPLPGRQSLEILENCFEAFMGALFLDYKYNQGPGQAYQKCRDFIVGLMENIIDFSDLILKNDNYKNILQHFFHVRKWTLPLYVDINNTIDKNPYTRGIYIERHLLSESEIYRLLQMYSKYSSVKDSKIIIGLGSSFKKKDADQICAQECLKFFCPEELELNLTIL